MQPHDRIAAVHAVFGCIVVLILLPGTLLFTRLQRRRGRAWFGLHAFLNACVVGLIILVFALGMASVGTAHEGAQFSGDGADLHHQLGLALLLLVVLQAVLGVAAHFFAPANKGRRPPASASAPASAVDERQQPAPLSAARPRRPLLRIAHNVLGLATAGLLYWLVWDGLHTEWVAMSVAGTTTPQAVQLLFWVLFVPPIAAYAALLGAQGLGGLALPQQQMLGVPAPLRSEEKGCACSSKSA